MQRYLNISQHNKVFDFIVPTFIILWSITAIYSLLLSSRPIYLDGIAYDITTPIQRQLQMLGAAFVAICLLLRLKLAYRAFLFSLNNPIHILFWLTILVMAISAILRSNITALAYTIYFASAFVLFVMLWLSPRASRNFFVFGFTLISATFISIALMIHGLPSGRWIGGIHPNLIGFVSVAAGIGLTIIFPRAGWAGYALALTVAIIVSSRYSILILFCWPLIWVAVKTGKQYIHLTFLFTIIAISFLFVLYPFLSDLFQLDSRARGLGSGGTGRLDLWQNFVPQLSTQPLGFGFRSRGEYVGTHNGYLNFILENGLIASATFFTALVLQINLIFRRWVSGFIFDDTELFLVGCLFAASIAGLLQPQIISFGDAPGILMLAAISYPFALRRKSN